MLSDGVDVLNRIQPPYLKSGKAKSNTVDASDARQKADQARHLSKYIFARQYGLSNPFHSRTSKSSAFSFGDYMDREPEIKVFERSCQFTRTWPLVDFNRRKDRARHRKDSRKSNLCSKD